MSSEDQSNSPGNPPEGYYDWLKSKGSEYYSSGSEYASGHWESARPWLEDQYLKWFTNHNKTSYAAEDTLNKTQVFDDKGLLSPLGKAQQGLNSGVAEQFGRGGALQGVGDMTSEEGMNRIERGGKDDQGSYIPSMGNAAGGVSEYGKSAASGLGNAASGAADTGKNAAGSLGGTAGGAAESGKNAAGSVGGSLGGAASSLGGMLGGGNSQEQQTEQQGKQ